MGVATRSIGRVPSQVPSPLLTTLVMVGERLWQ